jgi:hypothetical protein
MALTMGFIGEDYKLFFAADGTRELRGARLCLLVGMIFPKVGIQL